MCRDISIQLGIRKSLLFNSICILAFWFLKTKQDKNDNADDHNEYEDTNEKQVTKQLTLGAASTTTTTLFLNWFMMSDILDSWYCWTRRVRRNPFYPYLRSKLSGIETVITKPPLSLVLCHMMIGSLFYNSQHCLPDYDPPAWFSQIWFYLIVAANIVTDQLLLSMRNQEILPSSHLQLGRYLHDLELCFLFLDLV